MFSIQQITYNLKSNLSHDILDAVQEYLVGIGYDFSLRKISKTLNETFGLDAKDCIKYHQYFRNESPWDSDDNNLTPDFTINNNVLIVVGGIGNCLIVTLIYPSSNKSEGDKVFQFMKSEFVGCDPISPLIDSLNIPTFGDSTYLEKLDEYCTKHPELKFKDLVIDDASVKSSREIMESAVRKLLIEVSMNKKVKYEDLVKSGSEETLIKCTENGMLKTEIMVQCKSNSSNLAIINSQNEFDGVKTALRCAHCNREYKDEIISKIVSLNSDTKALITKSHWMNYVVVDELLKLGVSRDLIKVSPEGNGEELDLLVAYGDKIIFFEFKDRDFGLGDAYPFHFRLRRYSADTGVIITTSKIADDAKKYLSEISESENSMKVREIEGVENISKGVKRLILELNYKMAIGIVGDRLSNTGIAEIAGIKKWMAKYYR